MRWSFVLSTLVAIAAACGPPKLPNGPAPEYEDPPAPSWQKDGGAPAPAELAGDGGPGPGPGI